MSKQTRKRSELTPVEKKGFIIFSIIAGIQSFVLLYLTPLDVYLSGMISIYTWWGIGSIIWIKKSRPKNDISKD